MFITSHSHLLTNHQSIHPHPFPSISIHSLHTKKKKKNGKCHPPPHPRPHPLQSVCHRTASLLFMFATHAWSYDSGVHLIETDSTINANLFSPNDRATVAKLAFFSVAMIAFPIGTYFLTVDSYFGGKE